MCGATYTCGLVASSVAGSCGRMLVLEVCMGDEGLIAVVRDLGAVVNRLLRQLEANRGEVKARQYSCEELLRIADEFNPSGSTYKEQAR